MAWIDWLGSLIEYLVPFALLATGVFFVHKSGVQWGTSYKGSRSVSMGVRLRLKWFVSAVTLAGVIYGGNSALGPNTTERLLQALLIGLGYSFNQLISNIVSGTVSIGHANKDKTLIDIKNDDASIKIEEVYLTHVEVTTDTQRYRIAWSEYFDRVREQVVS